LPKRNDLEKRAQKLILDNSTDGILQRDMWRELHATSREGSRISLRLETKNLIKRERELANGRWTYRIYINKRPLEIDSILEVPCIICENIQNCEMGGDISASTCDILTQWLLPHYTPS
jgi:hypothetical protein